MNIARWIPGLGTLATYKASFLPHDLAAGLTLGAVMVPVGLAYGELAGLPLAGLYGSMLPLLAYALFGSSRQLIVGPDTAMAALVAIVVVPLAPGDPGRLALLAAGLGVMVGILCLLGGVLRLGFVANFLSKPVIVGFMHGLALVIAMAQLPKVLGVKSNGETTLEQVVSLLHRLGDTNLVSLAIGAGTFAVILLCRRFAPRVPGAVLALAAAGLAVVLLGLDKQGVAVVGRIPTGLPGLSLPVLTLADFEVLLPVAFVAALLSFSDTIVTARAFAARNRYRIDANQELLAIGAANLVSGLSQGLPISASDSRTAVAEAAGGRTQVTSAIAAVVVAAVMFWLAGFLYYLPSAALGGLLIASAWGLCDTAEFRRLWRFRGISLAGALVTMAGVVALGVMEGILIGVVFSLVLLLRALAFPPDAVLGRTPGGSWHDTAHRPEAVPVPGLLVYRFSAPLFFANCTLFRDRIAALIEASPAPVLGVVIDGGAIHDVDLMGCETLAELEQELRERGIRLVFGNLRDRVRRDIERGLDLGPDNDDITFPSVAEA
ncbi:MAG: SulP family inorganic anion transporter, partial [Pseudomonadota bacterium]